MIAVSERVYDFWCALEMLQGRDTPNKVRDDACDKAIYDFFKCGGPPEEVKDYNCGNVVYDLMHNCCLGVLQLFNASVLIHVLQEGVRMHGTVEQRKDSLWVSLLACYDELDTPSGERIPHSKFSAVLNAGCSAEYPDMHCKAAHARHLLFALNLLVCKRLDLNEGAFRSTRVCLAKLSRFYRICMFSDDYISELYQTEAKECLDTFLLHQNLLNAHMRTASRPRLLYGITIKNLI